MASLFKAFTSLLLLILLTELCSAQYYYKDLIVTAQTAGQWQRYKDNKVKAVSLGSFEANGQPSQGFQGQQEMGDLSRITTHTRATGTPESWIFASYSPGGWPTRIVDSSDTYRSVSAYHYDAQGRVDWQKDQLNRQTSFFYDTPTAGSTEVVDPKSNATVDTYSTTEQAQVVVYSTSGLPAGPHTVTIRVAGAWNPAGCCAWIVVDAFDVSP